MRKRVDACESREIALTGERKHNRVMVVFDGRPVNLTYTSLQALVALILARANSSTGFQQLDPVAVARVRQILDEGVGPGAGMRWIETGCGSEYRISINRKELRTGLIISRTFFELEATRFVRSEQVAALRQIGRVQKFPMKSA